jgi:hypothetical protein
MHFSSSTIGSREALIFPSARRAAMEMAPMGQARAQREQPAQRVSLQRGTKPLGLTARSPNSLMPWSCSQQQPQQLHR